MNKQNNDIDAQLKILDSITDKDITAAVARDADAAPLLCETDALKKTRGTQKAPTKVATTIRLSNEVVEFFKSSGSGWQTQIDKVLKEYIRSQ